MSTEASLLQAIQDDPADVASRLVFADWLEERDDPRGEFLRVQTELLGWVPWFRCRAAAAEAAWLRALEYARQARDSRTEAQSLNMLVGAVWFQPELHDERFSGFRGVLA